MKHPTANSAKRNSAKRNSATRTVNPASAPDVPPEPGATDSASATGAAGTTGKTRTTGMTPATGMTRPTGKTRTTGKTRPTSKIRATGKARATGKTRATLDEASLSDSTLPLIIGHRGASAVAPENTLAAFVRALDDGADGIEFDVRLARDGVPVVIHDATLRRTAGLDVPIAALSSSDLSAVDVGSWFNRRRPARAIAAYAPETIPTLASVFLTVAPRCRLLYVELKCETGETARLVERVVAEVRAHGLERRVVIESFTLAAVAEAKRLAPDIRTAAAFERRPVRPLLTARALLQRARDARADELALARSLVSRRTVEAARARGLQTVVWTVDHPSWFARACALGLRAVITNDPARMRAARDEFLKP
ncbi:MAG TPA: glycerophosphodiester phosphodiesterase [Pyrinomonadaceae bacterium]|jgi:glycerophosphoryl diester phosphodiesterase